MSFHERKQTLIQLLKESQELSTSEIAKILYVSEPTVRRDLKKLEESGEIIRVHGGAKNQPLSADLNTPYFIREDMQNVEKALIGQKAASLVDDGDVIFLDASSTTFNMLPYLKDKKNIIVITNGAKTALLLGQMGIKNICTGGRMLKNTFAFVGYDAMQTLKRYNADKAFVSCHGLSLEGHATDKSIEENDLRLEMMTHAKQSYLLCDSSKFGKTYLHTLCDVEVFADVLSDAPLPKSLSGLLKK